MSVQNTLNYSKSDPTPFSIIRIPFTGSVKLRSVLLKSGPEQQTPARMSLVCPPTHLSFCPVHLKLATKFANADNVDFSDIADKTPDQEFAVPQSRDIGEYSVKCSSLFVSLHWNVHAPLLLEPPSFQTFLP